MKAKELREKSDEDLRSLEREIRDELFRLRMRHYSGQLRNTGELSIKRKTIARIRTLLGERSA